MSGNTPWYKGDRKPVWDFLIEPDSGTFDTTGLTESDFSLVLIDINNDNTPRAGTGAFSNLTAASGSDPASIQYAPGATDVGTAGIYEVRLIVDSGTSNQRTFSQGLWQCVP
jgi:hypothetical protein